MPRILRPLAFASLTLALTRVSHIGMNGRHVGIVPVEIATVPVRTFRKIRGCFGRRRL